METRRLHLLSLFSKKMIKNWSQARISPQGFAWETGLKMPWEMREVLYKLQMLRPTAIICISAYVRHYSYWLFSYYCYRLSYHQSRCHHVVVLVVLQVSTAHVIYFIHHTCTCTYIHAVMTWHHYGYVSQDAHCCVWMWLRVMHAAPVFCKSVRPISLSWLP